MAAPNNLGGAPVVFFDGECLFCNRMVALIARLDARSCLFFAPLQGETARAVLPTEVVAKLEAVVFYQNGRWLAGSDAALAALLWVGGLGRLLGKLLGVVPRAVREAIYALIARNRRRILGSCPLPQGGKAHFLP
jgi:predicted DCC family thiol-disulfide oxidoreductase YuxK